MSIVRTVARVSRPIRRIVTPLQFKETYVKEALARSSPTLYVEIGVRDGESFRLANADRKIGIDPVRLPPMESLRQGEEFYEKTSDDFFSIDALSAFSSSRIDVALIDGLHEFRQALRDLMNLSAFMKPDGVIILDDCNPQSAAQAVDVPTGIHWNGDVWKIAPLIASECRGLSFITVDADQGVGIVRGFGSEFEWPTESTIDRYKDLEYAYLASDRKAALNLVRAAPLRELPR